MPPLPFLPRTPADLISQIREYHRKREIELRSEGDSIRRIKSVCRRASGAAPGDGPKEATRKEKQAAALFQAVTVDGAPWPDDLTAGVALITGTLRSGMHLFAAERKASEKQLLVLAKRTHVAPFVEATPGFGYLGLSQIIGEAGDLGAYPNPAKLWKRFGLGLISSGERQRKFADAAKAAEAGYSPRRRSTMFVLGDALMKAKGPYRELYLARKLYEQEKAPALTKMAWHRRAQRYMEKRLMRDLWRAWRLPEGAA